jgi:hypothetical protein
MIKLILKLCFICSCVFVGTTQAALINVTQEEYYITVNNYNNSGIDIDIAWVSSVNAERYYFIEGQELKINTLYSPDKFHIGNDVLDDGWHFAEDNALSSSLLTSFSGFVEGALLDSFTTTSNTYINAFQYWNSYINDTTLFLGDIQSNFIGSEWVWDIAGDDVNIPPKGDPSISELEWSLSPELWDISEQFSQKERIERTDDDRFETFYFRVNDAQTVNSTPVPEPSTLMIFALGLIALVSKKRLFN